MPIVTVTPQKKSNATDPVVTVTVASLQVRTVYHDLADGEIAIKPAIILRHISFPGSYVNV